MMISINQCVRSYRLIILTGKSIPFLPLSVHHAPCKMATNVGLWSEFGAICSNEVITSLVFSIAVYSKALVQDKNGVMRPLSSSETMDITWPER